VGVGFCGGGFLFGGGVGGGGGVGVGGEGGVCGWGGGGFPVWGAFLSGGFLGGSLHLTFYSPLRPPQPPHLYPPSPRVFFSWNASLWPLRVTPKGKVFFETAFPLFLDVDRFLLDHFSRLK